MLSKNETRKTDSNVVGEIDMRIVNNFRGTGIIEPRLSFTLVYLAHIALTNEIDNVTNLFNYIGTKGSEQREMFVKEVVGENAEFAIQLSKEFSEGDLIAYLFEYPRDNIGKELCDLAGTPESISKLALRILDIKEDERVADFGSGSGDFLLSAGKENNAQFYGIELNTYSYEISKIRSELFMDDVELELGDMFELPDERRYEKVFSNYPFGVRLINLQTKNDYIDKLYKEIPEMRRATSADWIYNSLIVDHLTDSGKAVAIMTNGSSWNGIDQRIREHFIRKGYIEAIIALPSKLFDFTSIPTTMVVLSKGNDSVRMIDATNLCKQGRRQNTFSEKNINCIINLLTEDSDESVTVNLKTLQENEFVLNPSRYLSKKVEIEDGVEFGSLMKRITRGAPIKASSLDEMVSQEPTDVQYLMLSNIQNGMISEDLPYLKEIDSKLDKYCIGNRNLLLSKNGSPFKVAVAEVDDGRRLLGNGNLYIIELDEEKVNPYFIKAFFDSELGENVLNSIVVGATIPNIPAEALKKLVVPLPSMNKQNEIANRYQAKQDEIKVLQLKLRKAQDDLRGIFGEVD